MRPLGKRISIIGSNSSVGKSTLAANLANKLGYPVVHLDQLHHYPDGLWRARPREEFLALLDEALASETWVMEGNYTRSMPQRFDRSDTIINIVMNNSIVTMWRFLKRHFQDKKGTVPQVGRIEAPSHGFNWKMIYWILVPKIFDKARRKKLRDKNALLKKHADKVITLRSFKEIDRFLKNASC